jgi:hypothetical protein
MSLEELQCQGDYYFLIPCRLSLYLPILEELEFKILSLLFNLFLTLVGS